MANDSSIAVPATMLIVAVPVLVLVVLRAAPGGIRWTGATAAAGGSEPAGTEASPPAPRASTGSVKVGAT